MGFAAEYSPFYGIEKGAVLQEARVFNDPQLDARRCAQVQQHFCLFVRSFVLQIVFCFSFFQFLCSTAILGLQPKFKNSLGVGFLRKILS